LTRKIKLQDERQSVLKEKGGRLRIEYKEGRVQAEREEK